MELLSLCTPVMNRRHDLERVMPYRIEQALLSPPIEFSILDYNSTDGLEDYINTLDLPDGITLTFKRYTGRQHWHMAHGFNLAILASSGRYFCLMGSDTYPMNGYFQKIRELIDDGCIWMECERYKGAIACQREEFINAGGYDERFEFYGPEDREIAHRLTIRGGKKGIIPAKMIELFPTPDQMKTANYRVKGNKSDLHKRVVGFYEQAIKDKVTVANKGVSWGQW